MTLIATPSIKKMDDLISEHNHKFEQGLEAYTMAHNQFSDMSPRDKLRYLGRIGPKSNSQILIFDKQ